MQKTTFSELIVDSKKKSPWRESIFTVTLNTNKSLHTKNEKVQENLSAMKKKFIEFLEGIFKHEAIPKLVLDLGKPGTIIPQGPNGEKVIGYPIDSQFAENNGDKLKEWSAHVQIESNLDGTGYLHAHATLKIVHNTRIQINTKLIQYVGTRFMGQYLKKKNGEQGHLYVRATGRSSSYVMENYTKGGSDI
jgi:hypothetical protein